MLSKLRKVEKVGHEHLHAFVTEMCYPLEEKNINLAQDQFNQLKIH